MSASKFTKQRASQIVVQMKDGVGLGRAAQLAGITVRTVYNWRKAGREEGQGAKHDFDRQVGTCEAEQLAEAERTVRSILGDREDARALNAATWLLERRLPDEYGRRDEVRIKVESALKEFGQQFVETTRAAVVA